MMIVLTAGLPAGNVAEGPGRDLLDHLLGHSAAPLEGDFNGDGHIDIGDFVTWLNQFNRGPDRLRIISSFPKVIQSDIFPIQIDLIDGDGRLINPGVPEVAAAQGPILSTALPPTQIFVTVGGAGTFAHTTNPTDTFVIDSVEGVQTSIRAIGRGAITICAAVTPEGTGGIVSTEVWVESTREDLLFGTMTLDGAPHNGTAMIRAHHAEDPLAIADMAGFGGSGNWILSVPYGDYNLHAGTQGFEQILIPSITSAEATTGDDMYVLPLTSPAGQATVNFSVQNANNSEVTVDIRYFDGEINDPHLVFYRDFGPSGLTVQNMPTGTMSVTCYDIGGNMGGEPPQARLEVSIPDSGTHDISVNVFDEVIDHSFVETGFAPRAEDGVLTLKVDLSVPDDQRPVSGTCRLEFFDFGGRSAGVSGAIPFTLPVGGPACLEIERLLLGGSGGEETREVRILEGNLESGQRIRPTSMGEGQLVIVPTVAPL